MKEIRLCLVFLDPVKNAMLTAQYSYDLTVNSFGKAFAHERNCLLMKKMCSNRIVEEQRFYTETTQNGGFSKLCAKIKTRDVIPTYSIF